VEPESLIVSEYDGRTFALWFYKATEFRRTHPHLAVVYKYLLVWPWYQRQIAHAYPTLSVPPYPGSMDAMMNRLISRNIRKMPVYLVRRDPALLPIFETETVGYGPDPLYRVRVVERLTCAGLGPFLERRSLALLVVLVATFHAGRIPAEQVITEAISPARRQLHLSPVFEGDRGRTSVRLHRKRTDHGRDEPRVSALLVPPHLFRMPPSFPIGWALALGLFGYDAKRTPHGASDGRAGGALAPSSPRESLPLMGLHERDGDRALRDRAPRLRAYIREREAARFRRSDGGLRSPSRVQREHRGVFGSRAVDRVKAARREPVHSERSVRAAGSRPDALSPRQRRSFLVNLLVPVDEATSSQAKSILAEPYRDTKLIPDRLPSVWLAI
jgi:hypothetical protein